VKRWERQSQRKRREKWRLKEREVESSEIEEDRNGKEMEERIME
jgi:hypothetical protein